MTRTEIIRKLNGEGKAAKGSKKQKEVNFCGYVLSRLFMLTLECLEKFCETQMKKQVHQQTEQQSFRCK